MKFKVGDKVVLSNGNRWFDDREYKVVTGCEKLEISKTYYYYVDNNWIGFGEESLKLYEEEEKMEKTFREVIRDIKLGEIWEDQDFCIYLDDDYLEMDFKDEDANVHGGIEMKLDDIFTLRRERVDLMTALKSYDEGKVIVSCITGSEFRKSKNRDAIIYELKGDSYEYTERNDAPVFSFEEIKGDWYVNE